MRKVKVYVALIIASMTLSLSYVYSQDVQHVSRGSVIELNSKWYFIPKDDIKNAEIIVNLSDWIRLNPYPTWTASGIKRVGNYYGSGWYRHYLTFSKNTDYSIILPLQYGGSQIYFNGKKIFESRVFGNNGFEKIVGKPQIIHIPEKLIQDGQNIIAFRTACLNGLGGLSNDPILIGEENFIFKRFMLDTFHYAIISGMIILAGLIFLIIFFARTKDIYYLYYFLTTVFVGIWLIGVKGYFNWIIDTQEAFVLSTYCSAVLISAFLVRFVDSFLGFKYFFTRIISWIFIILGGVAIGEQILRGNLIYYQTYFFYVFIVLSGLVTVYTIILTIKGILRKIQYSKIIFTGLFILLATYSFSSLDFMDIAPTSYIFAEGFFLMTISFTIALALQFASVHNQLERANVNLVTLDHLKDEFLANTSHELRTPLHGIIGLSESVLHDADGTLTYQQKENLNMVLQSGRHLTQLVDEILEFSRLKVKKTDIIYEEVILGDVAESTVSLLRQSTLEKNLKVVCDIDKMIVVQADRRQIFQVFINIIGNAIKYSENGTIRIKASTGMSKATVSVSDEGKGISNDDIARIWIPFEKADENTSKKEMGSGLGLPISREIISMHGGEIWVESVPGKGSTFNFTLPLKKGTFGLQSLLKIGFKTFDVNDSNRVQQYDEMSIAGNGDDMSVMEKMGSINSTGDTGVFPIILAVDDDKTNLAIIKNICSDCRYQVITAVNENETFEILEQIIPDLILMDIMLPGISGYEICHKIRENNRFPFIPIMMLTAKGFLGDKIKGFSTGANDYLVKPFNRNELIARMENLLAIKKLIDMEKSVASDIEETVDDGQRSIYMRTVTLKEATDKLIQSQRIISHNLHLSKVFLDRLMTVNINSGQIAVSVYCKPLLAIGGDIYHVYEYQPGTIRVFLADATGHGINASLNSISILTEYSLVYKEQISPAEILSILNKQYCHELREYKMSFNCLVVDIDCAKNEIVFATAGHPEQIMVHPGGELVPVVSRGSIIGLWPEAVYQNKSLAFKNGSILALFTDGLLPGFSSNKGGFNTDDIAGLITDISHFPEFDNTCAQKIAEKIPSANDDVTVLIFKNMGC
jgi:two-component system sensor histidine kinase ChiS